MILTSVRKLIFLTHQVEKSCKSEKVKKHQEPKEFSRKLDREKGKPRQDGKGSSEED